MSKYINITGKVFGRLTAVERVKNDRHGRTMWLCLCSCGSEVKVLAYSLRSGHSKSCGCLKRDLARAVTTTHGSSKTKTYKLWAGMKDRCNNPNNSAYFYYGDRGIGYCKAWEFFEAFSKDMGPRPRGATLERLNNNADYSPDNCVWASKTAQANNRRSNKHLTFRGTTKTVSQWSNELGIPYGTLWSRIRLGWPVEEILMGRAAPRARVPRGED